MNSLDKAVAEQRKALSGPSLFTSNPLAVSFEEAAKRIDVSFPGSLEDCETELFARFHRL